MEARQRPVGKDAAADRACDHDAKIDHAQAVEWQWLGVA
jgi:hypothetical protein